jgi:predicted site-specific integrase-resolvase
MSKTPELLTAAEVAQRLHVATDTVLRWVRDGELIGYQYPAARNEKGEVVRRGVIKIDLASVREFLALAARSPVQVRAAAARRPEAWGRASCN